MHPTALIAEDEPLLALALRAELETAWPELEVVAIVGDGRSAVEETLRLLPQILFFDIRMPGLDGLGAAAELADSWPTDEAPMPRLVFVTAYDEYATRAFETEAIDYVLKPVQGDRLRKTVSRLKQAVAASTSSTSSTTAPTAVEAVASQSANDLEQTLAQWRQLLAAAGASAAGPAGLPSPGKLPGALPHSISTSAVAPLKFIAASDAGGATVRMVPMDEVLYFEAADKYVRVLTAMHEYLIRTPLKQLMPQLDAGVFWQVHRAVVVRSDAVDSVHRDEAGKVYLVLRGRPEHIPVSRLYAHLFRAM
jgi:DNA-binding LytR/AlgR family response regulator